MTTLYQRAQNIDAQAHAALLPNNTPLAKALAHARSNSDAQGIPSIEVSPLQGQYLAIQAQLISAKSVLEVGTLGGYSAIWFASTGAKVTSLELDPHHASVARDNIAHAGFGDLVNIIVGPALETLPQLEPKKYDLIFIDADWNQQYEYFAEAVKLVRPGGAIYIDNVIREILEGDSAAEYESGKKETLMAKVGKMDNVQATLVPVTSSHKGNERETFDGFLLAIVKG